MRQLFLAGLALALVGLLAACAQTNYQVYEGRSDKIVDGQGGTKQVIDGYEVWDNGTPPRRYKVLGVTTIEDFDNVFGNSRIRSAIADQIKAAGGDAAVMLDGWSQGQSIGTGVAFGRGGTAFGTGQSFGRKNMRLEIIKYLDAK